MSFRRCCGAGVNVPSTALLPGAWSRGNQHIYQSAKGKCVMSVQKRRRQAINRRRWVAELREKWDAVRETRAILNDPAAMAAIAEAEAEVSS